jgi:hypothetical protein
MRIRRVRVDHVRAACAERGIDIRRHGDGFRLVGPGVDLLVADLSFVRLPFDLMPAPPGAARDHVAA